MALAPLRPAGERATGVCWRERLSRPREPGRGDEMPELEREVMADGIADSRSRGGERCLKPLLGPYRSSRRSGRSGERDRGRYDLSPRGPSGGERRNGDRGRSRRSRSNGDRDLRLGCQRDGKYLSIGTILAAVVMMVDGVRRRQKDKAHLISLLSKSRRGERARSKRSSRLGAGE